MNDCVSILLLAATLVQRGHLIRQSALKARNCLDYNERTRGQIAHATQLPPIDPSEQASAHQGAHIDRPDQGAHELPYS